ncbi:MAG TPA: FAD-dependent oxidoreductase, partial [Clostridia bacterium]|nr:FAD-dependent oxidoreductase [Clostridia bacterium]
CVDLHAPHGLLDFDRLPSDCNFYEGVYTIPYRCFYSRNIANLMMAGRDISASRLAMASTRIIGCCASGGEAVGIAAAACLRRGCLPRELTPHIREVQQAILRDGGFLPDYRNEDPDDLARGARLCASSHVPGGKPEQAVNGIARRLGANANAWISAGIAPGGETLTMRWDAPQTLSQLRFTFHSDFRHPIRITMSPNRQAQQRPGVPAELVKDYDVTFKLEGAAVRTLSVRDNHQRLNVLDFDPVRCDCVELHCLNTHGVEEITVFEVRAYV